MPTTFIQRHYPLFVLLLLFALCELLGSGASEVLRYERDSILQGEVYRLISAHIVHLNWVHSSMNALAAAIIWYVFRDVLTNRQWLLSLLSCALIISVLLLRSVELHWYVGFSGIVHGLMVQCLVLDNSLRRWAKFLLLGALLSKVAYEMMAGPSRASLALIQGNIVVEAHLYGVFAGFVNYGIVKKFAAISGTIRRAISRAIR